MRSLHCGLVQDLVRSLCFSLVPDLVQSPVQSLGPSPCCSRRPLRYQDQQPRQVTGLKRRWRPRL